ncbi:MAG: glycosyltransferase family 4 protein [Planctomycetes bacterium]|nr:glycosyltransferase family 4 protein [Planctomycetota bacterium]
MKVAFVNHPWDSIDVTDLSGSLPIWTFEVARRLTRVDAVSIYARLRDGQPETESHDHLTLRRIRTPLDPLSHKLLRRVPFVWHARQPLFASRMFHTTFIKQVAASLSENPCDVVHIHNFVQYAPMVRRALPRAKIVLHMHCEWLSQLDARCVVKHLDSVDAVFACSQYLIDQFLAKHPQFASICHCVYNGVNTNEFSPHRTRVGDTKRILFVGRLSPEKGLHVLADAFNKVSKREPQAVLELVGPDGSAPKEFIVDLSDDERIKALARFYDGGYTKQIRKRLSPSAVLRTEFVGGLPQPRLVDRYREADILVNPSLSESFGMSLIEAMACGTCVVAAKSGGMPEIVKHGETGLLVEPDAPSALADAMCELLSDPNRRNRMGAAGRARVLETFTWDRIAAKVAEQYHALIGQ